MRSRPPASSPTAAQATTFPTRPCPRLSVPATLKRPHVPAARGSRGVAPTRAARCSRPRFRPRGAGAFPRAHPPPGPARHPTHHRQVPHRYAVYSRAVPLPNLDRSILRKERTGRLGAADHAANPPWAVASLAPPSDMLHGRGIAPSSPPRPARTRALPSSRPTAQRPQQAPHARTGPRPPGRWF